MILLAIDTTGQTASTALCREGHTIAEFSVARNQKMTHSEILVPMIHQMMAMSGVTLEEVDYIACSQGPGSFTGLRVGAASARALAHALNKPMVPVPTLDSLAYNMYSPGVIVPMIDARRGQVYTAYYIREDGRLKRISEYMGIPVETVLEQVGEYGSAVFLGDGAQVYQEEITAGRPAFLLAPGHLNLQRAASVGALAVELAKEGKLVSHRDFELFYLRKPHVDIRKGKGSA